jgi:hypothetical protein
LTVTFGFVILLKLRKIRKLIVKLNNNLNLSLQKSWSESSESKYRYKWKANSNQKKLKDKPLKHDKTQVLETTSTINEYSNKHLKKRSDYSQTDLKTTTPTIVTHDKSGENLKKTADLGNKIINVLLKTDKAISVKDLVHLLPSDYFDGNYNPVLNEIERLERNGKIEGQSLGKNFYIKLKDKYN